MWVLQIKEYRLYENINSISIYVCAERSEAQQAIIEVKGSWWLAPNKGKAEECSLVHRLPCLEGLAT
jgi:hypothetical protein